eukprot:1290939-Lingulodinium_polyedra.AAC.1
MRVETCRQWVIVCVALKVFGRVGGSCRTSARPPECWRARRDDIQAFPQHVANELDQEVLEA